MKSNLNQRFLKTSFLNIRQKVIKYILNFGFHQNQMTEIMPMKNNYFVCRKSGKLSQSKDDTSHMKFSYIFFRNANLKQNKKRFSGSYSSEVWQFKMINRKTQSTYQ